MFEGWTARDRGHLDRAASQLHASLAFFAEGRDIWSVTWSLMGVALLAMRQGQAEAAARLSGAHDALRAARTFPLPPAYHPEYDAGITAARAALRDDAFTAAYKEGRVLSLDAVVAQALEQTKQPDRKPLERGSGVPL